MFVKRRTSWAGRITLSCIALLSGLFLVSAARAQSVHQEQTDVGAAVTEALDANGRAVAAAQDAVLARLPSTELTLLRDTGASPASPRSSPRKP